MASYRQMLMLGAVSVIQLSLLVSPVLAMNRQRCNADVIGGLRNGSLPRDHRIFYRENGTIFSDEKNIALTLPGCQETCGRPYDWYDDVASRLTTWLVPILILVGNIHFAPLGKLYSLPTLLHLLGDPIDSTWSLLTKLEVLARSYSLAERHAPSNSDDHETIRDRATVVAAIEEIDGFDPNIGLRLDEFLRHPPVDQALFDLACTEAADELADCRVDETPRSLLAILGYAFAIVTAFVDAATGQSTTQPGGRIAFAMLYAWLIPAVLLSAVVGGFPSRRSCLRILLRFRDTLAMGDPPGPNVLTDARPSRRPGDQTSSTTFYESQPWAGGIYSYRPNKWLFRGGQRDRHPLFLLALSILPMLFSFTASFLISWYTPTIGFTCRNITQIGILVGWLLSGILTWTTIGTGIVTGKYLWYVISVKDSIFASITLLAVVFSISGIFNSCWCWSAVYTRGAARAVVYLNPDEKRQENAKTIYPALVVSNLGVMVIIFFIMFFSDRFGRRLLRRDEKIRQADFDYIRARRNESLITNPDLAQTLQRLGGNIRRWTRPTTVPESSRLR